MENSLLLGVPILKHIMGMYVVTSENLTEVIIIIGVICITEWFKWGIPDFTSRDLTWLGLWTWDQGFPDLSPA